MAINNPEENTIYCDGTSGAVLEYQIPDRDIEEEDYEWGQVKLLRTQVPFRYATTATVGTFIESVSLTAGSSVTTAATLDKNKFYTFAAIGAITVSPTTLFDACFFADTDAGTEEPSSLLTTDDPAFATMFFDAADQELVEYDEITHQYSVGYIGNDSTVTFTLGGSGAGTIDIFIYENDYSITLANAAGTEVYFSEAGNKPYLNINVACGGDCPSRSSFSCECAGVRSCYWDDEEGNVTNIFEGSSNPLP